MSAQCIISDVQTASGSLFDRRLFDIPDRFCLFMCSKSIFYCHQQRYLIKHLAFVLARTRFSPVAGIKPLIRLNLCVSYWHLYKTRYIGLRWHVYDLTFISGWWSYKREGGEASERCSRVRFNICKCENTRYFCRRTTAFQHLPQWIFLGEPRENFQPLVWHQKKGVFFDGKPGSSAALFLATKTGVFSQNFS